MCGGGGSDAPPPPPPAAPVEKKAEPLPLSPGYERWLDQRAELRRNSLMASAEKEADTMKPLGVTLGGGTGTKGS